MSAPALPPRLSAPVGDRVDLLVVAGEHSGDEHAARAVAGLKRIRPELQVAALGGRRLEAAGAQLLWDLTSASVVGYAEVLKQYRTYFRPLFEKTLDWIARHQPRAVCFVDYPGFNLRLATALRERGLSQKGGGKIRTLFYISPQIWAWKAKRRFVMARDLDALAVIFPFEVKCYADTSLPVEFVGHPFAAADYHCPVAYNPDGPILLLPGSRSQAVRRIFPMLLRGFAEFRRAKADGTAVVLYPSDDILQQLEAAAPPEGIKLLQTPAGTAPVGASRVLTSSGTMSLHCALAGIPGAIVYRAHPLTYLLGRWLVKIPFLGIANLILGDAMYPEYLQSAATPARLARELQEAAATTRVSRAAAQAVQLRKILKEPAQRDVSAWLANQVGL